MQKPLFEYICIYLFYKNKGDIFHKIGIIDKALQNCFQAKKTAYQLHYLIPHPSSYGNPNL